MERYEFSDILLRNKIALNFDSGYARPLLSDNINLYLKASIESNRLANMRQGLLAYYALDYKGDRNATSMISFRGRELLEVSHLIVADYVNTLSDEEKQLFYKTFHLSQDEKGKYLFEYCATKELPFEDAQNILLAAYGIQHCIEKGIEEGPFGEGITYNEDQAFSKSIDIPYLQELYAKNRVEQTQKDYTQLLLGEALDAHNYFMNVPTHIKELAQKQKEQGMEN